MQRASADLAGLARIIFHEAKENALAHPEGIFPSFWIASRLWWLGLRVCGSPEILLILLRLRRLVLAGRRLCV